MGAVFISVFQFALFEVGVEMGGVYLLEKTLSLVTTSIEEKFGKRYGGKTVTQATSHKDTLEKETKRLGA